jgi:hypothetical protein
VGKLSRDKGARGEREVAELFRQAGFDAKRSVGQYAESDNAPDVVVAGLGHLWLEVKRGAKTNIRAALRQAKEEAKPEQWPIAITRDDREPSAVVSMSFDVFAALLRKSYPEAVVQLDLLKEEEANG